MRWSAASSMPTRTMKTAKAEPPPARAGAVEIVIQRACALRGLPTNADMKRWLVRAVGRFSPGASLTVRIVDAAEGAALNAPDADTFYVPGAKGYTDYPFYKAA